MRRVNLLKTVSRRQAAKKLRKPKSFRPRVVDLEVRVMLVVGSTIAAAIVPPGSNLDGVVLFRVPGSRGTGSELSNQTEILTATHVDTGGPQTTINYYLSRNGTAVNIPITIPSNAAAGAANPNFLFAPGYNAANHANDISVINLRDNLALPANMPANLRLIAPFSPYENGYPIVAPGAFPFTFNMVGYGLQGTAAAPPGGTGGQVLQQPVGTLTLGQNEFDQTRPAPPAAGSRADTPAGDANMLEYDSDGGGMNFFGTAGLGAANTVPNPAGGAAIPAPWLDESGFASGDSGAPALISGLANGATGPGNTPVTGGSTTPLSIVGVGSFSTGNVQYGTYGGYVTANAYNQPAAGATPAGFLWTAQNNTPYAAILDMRTQVLGALNTGMNPGGGAPAVLPQDPLTITVGRGTAFPNPVFQANGPNLLIQVTDTAMGLPANFNYASGFYFDQPVANGATQLITSLVERGNNGNDTFDILGNLNAGLPAGASIPITLIGGTGANTVEYLDQANAAATTYNVTAAPGGAAGLGVAATRITATPNAPGGVAEVITETNFSTLNIKGGNGGNDTFQVTGNLQMTSNVLQTVSVPASPAPGMNPVFQLQYTPAGGGAAITTGNIAATANIAAVQAALNATALGGNVLVGGAPGAWTLQLTNAQAANPGTFKSVNLMNLPGGVNVTNGTVSLVGGPAPSPGKNEFVIGMTDAGNLNDIATTSIVVNGGAGANNTLTINDKAAAVGRIYSMGAAAGPPPQPNVFTWVAPSNITFTNTGAVTLNSGNITNFTLLNALTAAGAIINGGKGGDSINVLGTTAGQQTVINAGSGTAGSNPAVNIGGTLLGGILGLGTLNNVKGTVSVASTPPVQTTLRVFDLNSAAGQTYTITTGSITRGNGVGAINYNGPSLLSLYAASAGKNMINIQSTSVPTYIATSLLSLFTSSPGNTINVGKNGSLAGIQAPVYVTGGGAGSNNILNVNAFANPTGGFSSAGAPPSWLPAALGEYSSISIGGSASINYRNTSLSYSLPDTPGLPANVCSIQTTYTVDNSALTTFITGSQGQDAVRFDVTAAGGLGTQTPAVHIDDDAGIATAQFNEGLVYSQQVDFDPVTDVSVTGGSFEVNDPVTAADAYVSAGLLTVDAGQTLDVTPGNVVLNGGATQIAAGAIDDAGDFTQFDDSVLGIGLTNGMPTPVTVAGAVSLSGELQLTAFAGFAPSPGQVITLIQNNGASAVSGEFQGLPEGATVVVGNYTFTISYHGGNNGQSVVLTELSAPPVNSPVANDIQVNMGQGQTAAIDLVGNSYISSGAALTASIVAPPTFGSVSYNAGNGLWHYTPTSASYTGPDHFTYQVSTSGGQESNVALVAIEVNPVNQAPSGTSNTVTIHENTSYTFSEADFGFSDPNKPPANFLAVEITSLPAAGSLTDNGVAVSLDQFVSIGDIDSGNLVFTPGPDESGSPYASFDFAVESDGSTAYNGQTIDPNPKTMTVDVLCVNQGPVGAYNTVNTLENTPYTFAAADFGFSDPTNNPPFNFSGVVITTLPAVGTLTDNGTDVTAGSFVSINDINNHLLVYTPVNDSNGAPYDSFTFQVQDDGGTANGGTDTDPIPKTMTIDVTYVAQATGTSGSFSPSSPSLGQAVTITATVAAVAPGADTPTGSVDFTDTTTGNDLGTFPLIGGSAQVTTNELALGNNSITLTYSGDANFAPRATTITITTIVADYVLSGTANGAVSLSGSASIDIPGLLQIDSSSSTALSLAGTSSVTASSIQIVGGYHNTGSGLITPTPTAVPDVDDPVDDPLAYLPVPSASTNPSTTGLVSYGAAIYASGSHPLKPGIYSEILLEGSASATLMPGLYVIQGGGVIVEGSATITGAGVVFYNTSNPTTGAFGSFLLTSSSTLSAPTSGTYAGVLLFQDRSDTKADEILAGTSNSNAAFNLSGTVYACAAPLTIGAKIAIAVDVNTLTLGGTAVEQALAVSGLKTVNTPAQIRTAYGMSATPLAGSGQRIAIVDIYDDPDNSTASDPVAAGTSQSALLSPALVDRLFQGYSVLPNQDFLVRANPWINDSLN